MMIEELPEIAPVAARRALILDNNDGNRMLLKFVMQMGKIEFIDASTARDALNIWKPGAYTFAFLDIELPDINGLEVARQMRAADHDLAIIMCSTNDDPQTVTNAVAAGCDMFLVKPFQLNTLMHMVKIMDRAALRSAPKVLIIDNADRPHWEERYSTVSQEPKVSLDTDESTIPPIAN